MQTSKLIGVIKEPNDIINIQNDIIKLQEWANTWQMSFNYDKCKVMHFGKKNLKNIYEMSDKLGSIHKIEKTESERDLGMIITNNLKWSVQVDKAAKTANSVLAQIKNSFTYFEAETVRLLYVALVRPHLEFAIYVWNPYFR